VRAIVAFLMVSVLLTCPVLCRAGERACCDHHANTTSDGHDESELPSKAPSDCGSCICDGAVKDTAVRGKGSTPSNLLSSPDLLPVLFLPPTLDLSALSRRSGRTPPDLHVLRTSQRTHALLQNFRC
jgi:hypothetical protein